MIPSLEGWPTKVKEAPSPHKVRLTLLDTNPVFLCLRVERSKPEPYIELFQKKSRKDVRGGVEDMELPGVLKNKNMEISRVDKEVEFPKVIKKKSCGIFMHPGFWPWKF